MMRVTAPHAAFALALLGLSTVPLWVGNSYYVDVASQILLFAVFALALNVLVGYGGLCRSVMPACSQCRAIRRA